MAKLNFGGGTHVGLKRQKNEDSYKADPSFGLWLIADGMGGANAGEVASKIAVEEVLTNVQNGSSLTDAILAAHQSIIFQSANNETLSGMGTTIVALKCEDNLDYEITWVGDSRAYLWDKKLSQLSRDHSYVQYLVDEGALDAQKAWGHPKSNIITQALGMANKNIVVDSFHGHLLEDQKILLCSDGLHGEIQESEIEDLLNKGSSNQDIADSLISAALNKGGKDNISVFVLSPSTQGISSEELSSDRKPQLLLLIIVGLIILVTLLSNLPSPPFPSP